MQRERPVCLCRNPFSLYVRTHSPYTSQINSPGPILPICQNPFSLYVTYLIHLDETSPIAIAHRFFHRRRLGCNVPPARGEGRGLIGGRVGVESGFTGG